jgi:hypothetical protein
MAVQANPILDAASAQAALLPHDVQGPGATSPFLGSVVAVTGVVTARTTSGFFIHTETNFEDADPNTSEGLFVSGVIDVGLVGHKVTVTGAVNESNSVTQLLSSGVNDEGLSTLPAAVELTDVELSPTGASDQLERFEGMRVTAMLSSVSPTALDGSFFAVYSGVSRPFREPGVEAGAPSLPCASAPCDFQTFDGNRERLRVDSDGVVGSLVVDVSVETFLFATGPLDFAAGAYTVLPEVTLEPIGGVEPAWVSGAGDNQFSVASVNLGAPANDAAAHDRRMSKASLMARWVLSFPDVIAVQEAEHASVLVELADRINQEAAASGDPVPDYAPVLDGFLVKSGRVSVVSAVHAATGTLFDHPPVVLRVLIDGGVQVAAQRLTLINNQFRSLAGVGNDDAEGHQARVQRRDQAEWLANFIDDRQSANPGERILSVGNYNAHAFNDGYVDVVGTVMGSPAPASRVVLASPALVSRPLQDLSLALPDFLRYSSIADGNAQSLDHMLASANLVAQSQGVAFARVNADFPEARGAVAGDPSRLSDRDPMVAFFSFPTDGTAPVFDAQPQDHDTQATGPDGAVVNYPLPTATDNVDASVVVSCSPASGSVFAVAATVVNCSAQDQAGNEATTSFTVTVRDTTGPAITVPADISEAATSAAGRAVTFNVSANDTVGGPVGVSCVPASGSTFPIGTTVVACSAADAAGNQSHASFNVTITGTQSVQGRIEGHGSVRSGLQRVSFLFDVRESATLVDRGWLTVLAKTGNGGLRSFVAKVTTAVFSNAPGYQPGRYPATGVDSVTFSGVGYWNGKRNYRFEVTTTDRGEPGAGRDTFTLVVKSPTGKVVESISGVLRDGNVQSRPR